MSFLFKGFLKILVHETLLHLLVLTFGQSTQMLFWILDPDPPIYYFLSILPLWGCETQWMPSFVLPAECGVEPAGVLPALRILPVLFHGLDHVGDLIPSLHGVGCGEDVLGLASDVADDLLVLLPGHHLTALPHQLLADGRHLLEAQLLPVVVTDLYNSPYSLVLMSSAFRVVMGPVPFSASLSFFSLSPSFFSSSLPSVTSLSFYFWYTS